VAALAGIPGAVVRDAKRRLRALENREISAGPQADLFASLPADEPELPGHPVLAPWPGSTRTPSARGRPWKPSTS
jgi:DNA mismatch repair protein MutS